MKRPLILGVALLALGFLLGRLIPTEKPPIWADAECLVGDLNGDGELNISDPVHLLTFLFLGGEIQMPCGDGTLSAAGNKQLLDSNGDSAVNLSDAVALLNFLFLSGSPPALGTDCVFLPECPDRCLE